VFYFVNVKGTLTFISNLRGYCQKTIDMVWMIASLGDEIEEKAERHVQVH